MDPSLAVWVIDFDPSAVPGLPALLGERARQDPTGTIWFKIGPADTDWALTPGGGGVPSAPGNATYWVSTSNATLTAEVDMGALASGIIYQAVALGVSTPAIVTVGTGLSFVAPTLRLADTAVTPGAYTYSSITVDQQGRLTSAANGTAPAPANATYITQTPDATLSAEQALSALSSGVMHSVTATGVVSTFAVTGAYIPYGSGSNGAITASAELGWNRFNLGVSSQQEIQLYNDSATTSALVGFRLGTSATFTNNFAFIMVGTGWAVGGGLNPNDVLAEMNAGSSKILFSNFATGDIAFATGAARTARLTIANAGTVAVANLTAGGVTYATAATGVLKIGTSAEVAAAITWPTAAQVLVSSGTTTAPVGDATFVFDTTSDELGLGVGSEFAHYNLGITGAGTYERVRALWTANTWALLSESGGGTVRDMVISADTATLTLTGGTSAVLVGGASAASAPAVTAGNLILTLSAVTSRTSSAGATLNAITVAGSTVSVTGNTNITTAAGFNYINVAAPTFSGSGGAKTITNAVTMAIVGPPAAAGDVTITTAITFWVQAGRSRFDGHFTGAGSGSNLGFFGYNGAAQVTGGAATAGVVWTATEQAMLQTVYDMARTYNLMT